MFGANHLAVVRCWLFVCGHHLKVLDQAGQRRHSRLLLQFRYIVLCEFRNVLNDHIM